MRKLLPIFLTCFAFLAVNACAGGDEEDAADAAPAAPDADTSPDAMPGNPPVTSGLGQVCTDMVACADQTTTCLSAQGATQGFCSFECAGNLAMGTNPEASASQACATAYTGTTGSPLCAARVPQQVGTNNDWYCVVACGTLNMQELGECPGGMTCTNNTCQ
jgi:hypothetical protein